MKVLISILIGMVTAIVTNLVSNIFAPSAEKNRRIVLALFVVTVVASILVALLPETIDFSSALVFLHWQYISLYALFWITIGILCSWFCVRRVITLLKDYRTVTTEGRTIRSRRKLLRIKQGRRTLQKNLGLALVGALGSFGLIYYGVNHQTYKMSLLPKEFIVLVADFEGPDPQRYRITETILSRLSEALDSYPNVVVRSLGRSISQQEGSDTARSIGEAQNASIVMWGWYGLTANKVPLSINFEILCPLKCKPYLGTDLHGKERVYSIVELDEFDLQSQIADEMAALGVYTVALERFSNADWSAASKGFTDVLKRAKPSAPTADVHHLRGYAYFQEGKYSQALMDFDQAIALDPTNANYYHTRGLLHMEGTGKLDSAIQDYNKAIELSPTEPGNYKERGVVYYLKKNYEPALEDLQHAITLFEMSNSDESDKDFLESFARAHVYVGTIYDIMGDYDSALPHLDAAIHLKPDYANAFFIRGAIYQHDNNKLQAINDFQQALSIGLEPERQLLAQFALDAIRSNKPSDIHFEGSDNVWEVR